MKKYVFPILFFGMFWNTSFSQSIVSNSESNSGILVGSDTDFVGIGFKNESSEFLFNYKFSKQDDTIKSNKDYPDFWGLNIGSSIQADKFKANLVSDEKWNAGVGFDLTIFRTWDNSSKSKEITEAGGITHRQIGKATQRTLYLVINDAFKRVHTMQLSEYNIDTTYASFGEPMQNILTITPGFYSMTQWKSKCFFSWAISANLKINNNSITRLTKTNVLPVSDIIYHAKDSTILELVGTQKTYYSGVPDKEFSFIPRADLFLRFDIGDKKPVLGILFAYSPIVSSLSDIKSRNNFAFGPTFGLDSFPDQVLFSVINQFNQDKDGDYKYSLVFQATIPIKFE
ncbi:hypothetical protein [Maribellus mangrovi]|uniref:hypothetical protein n=1 Tax=Maribellus mangrovi TaxID=3133146 RepID=UPI0030ECD5D4